VRNWFSAKCIAYNLVRYSKLNVENNTSTDRILKGLFLLPSSTEIFQLSRAFKTNLITAKPDYRKQISLFFFTSV
jgi:hypothetical protein